MYTTQSVIHSLEKLRDTIPENNVIGLKRLDLTMRLIDSSLHHSGLRAVFNEMFFERRQNPLPRRLLASLLNFDQAQENRPRLYSWGHTHAEDFMPDGRWSKNATSLLDCNARDIVAKAIVIVQDKARYTDAVEFRDILERTMPISKPVTGTHKVLYPDEAGVQLTLPNIAQSPHLPTP